MGDHLRADEPCRYATSHLGQLKLPMHVSVLQNVHCTYEGRLYRGVHCTEQTYTRHVHILRTHSLYTLCIHYTAVDVTYVGRTTAVRVRVTYGHVRSPCCRRSSFCNFIKRRHHAPVMAENDNQL